MLRKKEILAIPPLALPKREKGTEYAAAAAVVGDLLIVDIVGEAQRVRYACDGVNSIQAVSDEDGEDTVWSNCKIGTALGYRSYSRPAVTCSVQDSTLAYDFMDSHGVYHWRMDRRCLVSTLDGFCEQKNGEKQQKKWDNERALFQRLMALFPAYPADLYRWCEEKGVFGEEYLFISKKEKGKRWAKCSGCGARYKVTDGKHLRRTTCRRCGRDMTMIGEWYDLRLTARADVTICHKTEDNELLVRTVQVKREFSECKKTYATQDVCRVIYSKNRYGEPTIYSYALRSKMYCGLDWVRARNNDPFEYDGWIYPNNLREVFGDRMYNVDLQALSAAQGPFNMIGLLDELKNNPVAEYLFKLGLYRLCESGRICDVNEASGFGELLGINPQYKAMYRALDITYSEHAAIRWAKGYVHAEDMTALREAMAGDWPHQQMLDVLSTDTFSRVARYLVKQIALQREHFPKDRHIGEHVVIWLTDYWNICRGMDIALDDKAVRFPRDVKVSHDRLIHRKKVAQTAEEQAKMQRVVEEIYPRLVVPQSKKYTVVFPQTIVDFVREGEELDHCVGNGTYFREHIKGKSLIVFVRKIGAEEKALYTAQIDIENGRVQQIYGYKDSAAPQDARAFALKLAKSLLPERVAV